MVQILRHGRYAVLKHEEVAGWGTLNGLKIVDYYARPIQGLRLYVAKMFRIAQANRRTRQTFSNKVGAGNQLQPVNDLRQLTRHIMFENKRQSFYGYGPTSETLERQARTQEDSQVPPPMNVVPSLSLAFINSAATRCVRTPSDADGGGGGGGGGGAYPPPLLSRYRCSAMCPLRNRDPDGTLALVADISVFIAQSSTENKVPR